MSSTPRRPATQLVHGGTTRTPYGETSEALFLTSGFVYDSAEQAEATFTGNADHYQYTRFGNPTVAMLEDRLAGIEGAGLGIIILMTYLIALGGFDHVIAGSVEASWLVLEGAEGVGDAVNQSVVITFLLLFFVNFVFDQLTGEALVQF